MRCYSRRLQHYEEVQDSAGGVELFNEKRNEQIDSVTNLGGTFEEEYSSRLLVTSRNLRGTQEEPKPYNQRSLQYSAFQIKMYWKAGYCWQEEWIERDWCMECEGGSCVSGRRLRVEFCNATKAIQKFQYVPVLWGTGGQIKVASSANNLCLDRNSTTGTILLAPCQSSLSRQQFLGFQTNGTKFELNPKSRTDLCLTNDHHHPKAGEIVYATSCTAVRKIHTNEWSIYHGGSYSNPFTASDLTNLKIRYSSAPCSISSPCDMCEGDCNSDADCKKQGTSNLKCFLLRTGNSTTTNGTVLPIRVVPGCYGTKEVTTDYCYQPTIAH